MRRKVLLLPLFCVCGMTSKALADVPCTTPVSPPPPPPVTTSPPLPTSPSGPTTAPVVPAITTPIAPAAPGAVLPTDLNQSFSQFDAAGMPLDMKLELDAREETGEISATTKTTGSNKCFSFPDIFRTQSTVRLETIYIPGGKRTELEGGPIPPTPNAPLGIKPLPGMSSLVLYTKPVVSTDRRFIRLDFFPQWGIAGPAPPQKREQPDQDKSLAVSKGGDADDWKEFWKKWMQRYMDKEGDGENVSLGKIPYLSRLLRNNPVSENRREIRIFVAPNLVRVSEDEEN